MNFRNIYQRIAGSGDYQRNEQSLRLIQICVVTVSALATGGVNAFAHAERLGYFGAGVLALLVAGFVEKFYFTLRHGLTTTYKAGKQRFVAKLCYRTIQLTMVLNAAVMATWIVGFEQPPALSLWYHWSIVVHFALALIGVSAVRDSDAVIENRMLELKAATAQQDLVTIRRAAAIGNALVLISAKWRGLLDALGLAGKIARHRTTFAADALREIEDLSRAQQQQIGTSPPQRQMAGAAGRPLQARLAGVGSAAAPFTAPPSLVTNRTQPSQPRAVARTPSATQRPSGVTSARLTRGAKIAGFADLHVRFKPNGAGWDCYYDRMVNGARDRSHIAYLSKDVCQRLKRAHPGAAFRPALHEWVEARIAEKSARP